MSLAAYGDYCATLHQRRVTQRSSYYETDQECRIDVSQTHDSNYLQTMS
ncbi:MAG: hypothetical protein RIQ72_450, partial [Candidatus Parcubacteria bacterium]